MIFIDNKYTQWYFNIINNAKSRILKPDIYVERHHVIPKSIGGPDTKENLVRLTAKEHFVCHHLLIKMVEHTIVKKKMQWALNCFKRTSKNQNRLKLTASQYALIRKEFSDATKGIKRAPRTQEHKNNISIARKKGNIGKIIIPWNKGIPATADHKANNAAGNKGRKHSAEWSANMSAGLKGIKKPTVVCPHCDQVGSKSNMLRWHFDNCKLKNY